MIKTYAKVLTGFYKLCIIYLYYEKTNQQRENTHTNKILCIASADLDPHMDIYCNGKRVPIMRELAGMLTVAFIWSIFGYAMIRLFWSLL